MDTPYISVVIPTRNRPLALGNCINALCRQMDLPFAFEVIVVDDHSDPSFACEYQLALGTGNGIKLKTFMNSASQYGSVFARNLGLGVAQGQIVAFLDDDCIPDRDWLKTIYRYFAESDEISGLSGWIDGVELKNPLSAFRQTFYEARFRRLMRSETSLAIRQRFNLPFVTAQYLTDNLSGGNSAVRRTAITEVGGFDTDFIMMHDKEMTIRLLSAGYVCVFAPDLKVAHEHTKSATDAFRKSFYSGEFQFKLQRKHPNFHYQRVIRPLRPVQIIRDSRALLTSIGARVLYLVLFIFILEYLHQLGYVLALTRGSLCQLWAQK